jgi:hypothetical protein
VQKIITLILALALYAPNVAGLLAYSKCEVEAIVNSKPDCDCQLVADPQQNHPENVPNRHKEIVQQTDWKYIIQNSFIHPIQNEVAAMKTYQAYQSPYHPSLNNDGVFRPPSC